MQTGNSELKKKTIKTMKSKKVFRDEITARLSLTECKKIWYDAHKLINISLRLSLCVVTLC